MATNSCTVAVCPNCPADIKTGSPTITIVSGVATFSVAQTHSLMGMGMLVTFDTTTKVLIKRNGKQSTSVWEVTTVAGGTPSDTAGARTVNSITAPFTSQSAAEAAVTGSSYVNNTNITSGGANIDIVIACYCEQSSYTADTTAVTYNAILGGAGNRLYVMSPWDTATQCNLSMFPTTPKWDATKYRLVVTGNAFVKSTTASYLHLSHIQAETTDVSTSSARTVVSITLLTSETITVSHNMLIVTNLNTGVSAQRNTISWAGTSAGTIAVEGNICICLPGAGTNTGFGVRWNDGDQGTLVTYQNTIYGPFAYAVEIANNPTNTLDAKNNAYIGNTAKIPDSVTSKDYDVYDIATVETNGFQTSQTDAQLFKDVSALSPRDWDFTPKAGSDLLGRGTSLGTSYDGDFNHENGSGWRPQATTWDCGAVELRRAQIVDLAISPDSGDYLGGTPVTITATSGLVPDGSTMPTITLKGIAVSGLSGTDTLLTGIAEAGPLGVGDVYAENVDSQSATLTNGWEYKDMTPPPAGDDLQDLPWTDTYFPYKPDWSK